MGGNQAWVFNKMDKTLRHVNSGKCLTTQADDPGNGWRLTPSFSHCYTSFYFRHPCPGKLRWLRLSAVADAGQVQVAGLVTRDT